MSLKYEVKCDLPNNRNVTYYRHGDRHRTDGPASIWEDSDMFWMQYDILHRLDGPAEIYNGTPRYFICGEEYTKKEYESKIRSLSKLL